MLQYMYVEFHWQAVKYQRFGLEVSLINQPSVLDTIFLCRTFTAFTARLFKIELKGDLESLKNIQVVFSGFDSYSYFEPFEYLDLSKSLN